MQQAESNWELLAKALGQKEQDLGRPLTDDERREVQAAMERMNCDEVKGR